MSLLPAPPPTRQLGASGIEVSGLAWGMWRFAGDAGDAARLVHAVLDAGITLFDTADIYGFNGKDGFGDAETLLGRVFAVEPDLRGRMVLFDGLYGETRTSACAQDPACPVCGAQSALEPGVSQP